MRLRLQLLLPMTLAHPASAGATRWRSVTGSRTAASSSLRRQRTVHAMALRPNLGLLSSATRRGSSISFSRSYSISAAKDGSVESVDSRICATAPPSRERETSGTRTVRVNAASPLATSSGIDCRSTSIGGLLGDAPALHPTRRVSTGISFSRNASALSRTLRRSAHASRGATSADCVSACSASMRQRTCIGPRTIVASGKPSRHFGSSSAMESSDASSNAHFAVENVATIPTVRSTLSGKQSEAMKASALRRAAGSSARRRRSVVPSRGGSRIAAIASGRCSTARASRRHCRLLSTSALVAVGAALEESSAALRRTGSSAARFPDGSSTRNPRQPRANTSLAWLASRSTRATPGRSGSGMISGAHGAVGSTAIDPLPPSRDAAHSASRSASRTEPSAKSALHAAVTLPRGHSPARCSRTTEPGALHASGAPICRQKPKPPSFHRPSSPK